MAKSPAVRAELPDKDILVEDGEIVEVNSKGKRQNVYGQELPDPTPMAPPVGYNRQPSLTEKIRSMIRSEALRQEALRAGAETFDEADDFNVDDDAELDPHSQWENDFDTPVTELRHREQAERDAAATFPPAVKETVLEQNKDEAGLGVRPAIDKPVTRKDAGMVPDAPVGTHT